MSVGRIGGIPSVRRITTSTTGAKISLPSAINYLVARNKDATNIIRLFFTKADFDGDINFVEVPVSAAVTPHGEWAGPVETAPGSTFEDIWYKAVAGTPILELVVFRRRG